MREAYIQHIPLKVKLTESQNDLNENIWELIYKASLIKINLRFILTAN